MDNKQPPAFSFYAQDFLTGVVYLTNEEIGIYIKMLSKQWTDGKIPKKRLGFLVGFDWVNLSDELKSKFDDCGDYVINKRLEAEREKKNAFINKQSVNGKKGGRPKKDTKTKNPNESQKNPLEKGNRKKKKEIEEEIEIVYPFDSEIFIKNWKLWVGYKKKEFKFNYKSAVSEQAALKKLSEIANLNEDTAIKIIHESISNGWKGFFELKNKENGITKESLTESINRLIPE